MLSTYSLTNEALKISNPECKKKQARGGLFKEELLMGKW
jgi:hypothetical protein